MNQLEWEKHYREQKIAKTQSRMEYNIRNGYISETAVGHQIIKQKVGYISERLCAMAHSKARGMGNAYNKALLHASVYDNEQDFDKTAFIGLTYVLDAMFHARKSKSYMQNVALKIGERLEQEQQMEMLKRQNPDHWYFLQHHLNTSNLKGKENKALRRLKKEWEERGNDWKPWGTRTKAQLGLKIIKAIVMEMDEYISIKAFKEANRKEHRLVPSDDLHEFIREHTKYMIGRLSCTQPCVEQPLDWERDKDGIITGGFFSLDSSRGTAFIRTKSKAQRHYIQLHDPSAHISACNHLQHTEWELNVDAVEFLKLCLTNEILPDCSYPREEGVSC